MTEDDIAIPSTLGDIYALPLPNTRERRRQLLLEAGLEVGECPACRWPVSLEICHVTRGKQRFRRFLTRCHRRATDGHGPACQIRIVEKAPLPASYPALARTRDRLTREVQERRERQVLEALAESWPRVPSLREMGLRLGLTPGSLHSHLRRMVTAGLVDMPCRLARSCLLTRQGWEVLGRLPAGL